MLDAQLHTAKNGVTALFGASGMGKTTFLNCVAGLTRAKGRIRLNKTFFLDSEHGINVPTHRRNIGYVFETGRLFPHMTVRQNLFYGWRSHVQKEAIVDTLALAPLMDKKPATLSGGERQRVALGRTLLSGPSLLLMDEPLASVDISKRREIFPLLENIFWQLNCLVLYVSHNGREVMRLADSIALMKNGKIVAHDDAIKILNRPEMWSALDETPAPVTVFAVQKKKQEHGAIVVQIPGGHLFLPTAQVPRRICICARDVLLSTTVPKNISVRNVLTVCIEAITPVCEVFVDVKLRLVRAPKTSPLWARITRYAVTDMHLRTGQNVYALIKTAALS